MHARTQVRTHTHTYKCPCSKCCSSHDIQETPQLPSFCLERITLMHHMTPSWWLFPSLITANSPLLTVKQSVGLCCSGPHCIKIQLIILKYVPIHSWFKSQHLNHTFFFLNTVECFVLKKIYYRVHKKLFTRVYVCNATAAFHNRMRGGGKKKKASENTWPTKRPTTVVWRKLLSSTLVPLNITLGF